MLPLGIELEKMWNLLLLQRLDHVHGVAGWNQRIILTGPDEGFEIIGSVK
jgi:hypothetical protein